MQINFSESSSFELPRFELLKATQSAALNAYQVFGLGDAYSADQLATDNMRVALNKSNFKGTIVIGEGERDCAPMLYIGERVGMSDSPEIDIAVDPLEGTNILARGSNNAISVIAATQKGGLLKAPDIYMEKIAIGLNLSEQIVDLDSSPFENLKNVAKAKNCSIRDLVVIVLDRPRHEELIAKIREAGARVQLITDGDVLASIATASDEYRADVYMGIGGAPEGVLAAAALSVMQGQICTRLVFRNDDEKNKALKLGIRDLNKKYYLKDIVNKPVCFVATGVTDGWMLKGVKRIHPDKIFTHSVVMQNYDKNRTIEFVKKIFIS